MSKVASCISDGLDPPATSIVIVPLAAMREAHATNPTDASRVSGLIYNDLSHTHSRIGDLNIYIAAASGCK